MKDYMFLFRDCHPMTADMQSTMQKWSAWIEKLQKKGVYISGEPLEPGGKFVRNRSQQVTDGPYVESKGVVGGYFLIRADGIEAAEIAKALARRKSPRRS